MAKNRKTKKEKLRSSTRVKTAPSPAEMNEVLPSESSSLFTFVSQASDSQVKRSTVSTAQVSHLREDLLKTSTIVGAIILAEIILFFLLTRM